MKTISTIITLLLLGSTLQAQSGPCSGHGEFIQTGQWLGGMATSMGVDVGEVNGDGHPDLVFARDLGLGNQVYLGDGSGLFTDTGQSLGANNSRDVELADLDMDGDLDMVVANTQVGGPGQPNRIYFNDGLNTGNFIDSGQSLGNERTHAVATGDINGDTFIDLVFFNLSANCTVHLNDGNGGFGSPVQSLAMNVSFDGELADLNGDGHLDLVITDMINPEQKIFTNDGTGTFTHHSSVNVSSSLFSIAVADVDGDSLPDLICGANGPNQIFINDGSANFTDSGQLLGPNTTTVIEAGDIDGDCDADLVATESDGFFRVYRNDGGSFIGIAVNVDSGTALQLADVNHDDTLDLIVASGIPDMVYLNLGPGSDCNGNGIPDSVEISADPSIDCDENGTLDLCEIFSDPSLDCDGNGVLDSCEGGFVDSGQELNNFYSYGCALGDLDDDGDLDAWVANHNQANRVLINGGSGSFSDSGQALGNYRSINVALGDLDGDDDLDAWVANGNSQGNRLWINDGMGNFTDSGQNLGNLFSTDVSIGDLDGDGDLDAWITNQWNGADGSNRVWINDGSGNFNDSGQALGNFASKSVALGDLDGDDDLDAWVANYNEPNRVWINDGSGNFADSGQLFGNSRSFGVSLGDLDSDGDLDAWVANHNQPNHVWINDGLGNFSDSGQSLGNAKSQDVALGDVDCDGDLDAWVANYNEQNLVWINQGGIQGGVYGNFTDSGQALGNSTSSVVSLGDLDGDNDLDAWVANRAGQSNHVWINSNLCCDDCNGNGIQDSVEIAADPSLDCNANGVLDSCDIASGFSLDSDGSGVPDECEGMKYISGDGNGDGVVDVGDGIFVLDYLFGGGVSSCLDASDVNGDGLVDIGDAVYLLTYLFNSGSAPAAPFPACGEDPSTDALECESFDGC